MKRKKYYFLKFVSVLTAIAVLLQVSQITTIADIYDSDYFYVYQYNNGDSYETKILRNELNVFLVGNFTDWSPKDDWQFERGNETVFVITKKMSPGYYEYKCMFNKNLWYEKSQNRVLNILKNTAVTFIYDALEQKLIDSVNNHEEAQSYLKNVNLKIRTRLDIVPYYGDDLGANYSKNMTTFKVWAPTASEVKVNLYHYGEKNNGGAYQRESMELNTENGVWTKSIYGNLEGTFYTYSVTVNGVTNETVDIYAKAVGLNGDRGMVVDMDKTNPQGFQQDSHVTQSTITDAIIWENHIQDFSSSESSGVSGNHRGKYLAFTERGTTVNNQGITPTGIDYLKELGINYIHLLPCQDFENDENDNKFNWGYGPKNYNVPEGKYSTQPGNPYSRITEFKQMVQSLHSENIGVVMDVVYNHTFYTADSWFNKTVPGYYYRMDENGNFLNGTACGNETASEKLMFRKYMIDSILYWAKEYHIDGFRFDLMAIHDVDTMNAIRKALNDEGLSKVIMYGEPWDAGSNGLSEDYLPANKENAKYLMDGIAVFNDDFRDSVKGSVFNRKEKGFVQGNGNCDERIQNAIKANISSWVNNPSQSINYVSAHDNVTLWDKLIESTVENPSSTDYLIGNENVLKMNKMAAAILMTSQGAVFFQSGEEFARTKMGDDNSYESPTEVNQISWQNAENFALLKNYYSGLIELRKKYSPFRDDTNASINRIAFSNESVDNLVAYTIKNVEKPDEWDTLAVLFNSSLDGQYVNLNSVDGDVPERWEILVNQNQAGVTSLGTTNGRGVYVPAQSALVLVDSNSYERLKNKEDNEVKVTIEGFQINTSFEGHRTLYSVESQKDKVAEVGMIYGLTPYANEEDMIAGSMNQNVYMFSATEKGKVNSPNNSDTVQTYAMTMKLIKNRDYYRTPLIMRAYAKLNDGSYVYSEAVTISVFEIASYLYENFTDLTDAQKNYLYNEILIK